MTPTMAVGLVIAVCGFATFLIICWVLDGLPRTRAHAVYGVLIGGSGLGICLFGLVVFAIGAARAAAGA